MRLPADDYRAVMARRYNRATLWLQVAIIIMCCIYATIGHAESTCPVCDKTGETIYIGPIIEYSTTLDTSNMPVLWCCPCCNVIEDNIT